MGHFTSETNAATLKPNRLELSFIKRKKMKLIKKLLNLSVLVVFSTFYTITLSTGLQISLPSAIQTKKAFKLLLKTPSKVGKKITNPLAIGTTALWLTTEGIHSIIKQRVNSLPYNERPKTYQLQKELNDMYHDLEYVLTKWENSHANAENIDELEFATTFPEDEKAVKKLEIKIGSKAKKHSARALNIYNNYRSHFFIYSPMRLINPAYFLYHAYKEQIAYNTLMQLDGKKSFNKQEIINLKNSIKYLTSYWARSISEFTFHSIKRLKK